MNARKWTAVLAGLVAIAGLAATVDVYQAQDDRTARVTQLSGMPKLSGHAPTMTILRVAKVKLDKGDYRIEVSSTGDAPQLAGIEADLVMQMTPKTTCAKKPAT